MKQTNSSTGSPALRYVLTFGALVLAASLGFYAGGRAGPPSSVAVAGLAPAASAASSAAPAASAASAAQPSESQRIAQFRAIDWAADNLKVDPGLVSAMAHSPALVQEMLRGYRAQVDPHARRTLADTLSSAPLEVAKGLRVTALQWAASTQDVATRRDGLVLLSQMPTHQEAFELAKAAASAQNDVEVITAALDGLRRDGVPAPTLARQVSAQLSGLTRHAQPRVRANAIQILADWDRALEYFPADVYRLFSDKENDVRLAAMGATSIAGLSTPRVRRELIKILGDETQNLSARSFVPMHLGRFAFDEASHREYLKAYKAFEEAAKKLEK